MKASDTGQFLGPSSCIFNMLIFVLAIPTSTKEGALEQRRFYQLVLRVKSRGQECPRHTRSAPQDQIRMNLAIEVTDDFADGVGGINDSQSDTLVGVQRCVVNRNGTGDDSKNVRLWCRCGLG